LKFARVLVEEYVEGPRSGTFKTLMSLIDFAWSLVALELVTEFKNEFKGTLEKIFEAQPPQNKVPLIKLFDVICSIQLEHKRLRIKIPKLWEAACKDAVAMEMDKFESSSLHSEVLMRLDEVSGVANGIHWQLQMQQNQKIGPFLVDMFDTNTGIALDIDIISWPVSRVMKHRMIENLGYKPLLLSYWEWRRNRSEDEQLSYLERHITNLLEAGNMLAE